MRIPIDRDFLKRVTNCEEGYECPKQLVPEVERLKGMLENNVAFCSLITGYRGTGKTSFVKYALSQIKNANGVVAVFVNAAKYNKYKTFLRRFIRELYLKYKQQGNMVQVPSHLEELYIHTFCNVNDSIVLEKGLEEVRRKKNTKITERDFAVSFEGDDVKDVLLYFLTAFFMMLQTILQNAPLFVQVCSSLISLVLLIKGTNVCVGIAQKKKEEEKAATEEAKERKSKLVIETLYDDEIAEYHLFHVLENAKQEQQTIVFVLDELDKIEDKDQLDKIFRDFKPLFLSQYCDFILIAGKNMDKYMDKKVTGEDSVVASLFSNQIYVALDTIQEMRDFSVNFLNNKDDVKQDDVKLYFDKKILEAKGIKRSFINGILSDVEWDDAGPFVEYNVDIYEYSCAMKSHFRKSGNQMSGKWKSSYASLLA